MKKVILILMMNAIVFGVGVSQVFVSQVIEDRILFAPKNISNNSENLAVKYISITSDFKKEIEQEQKYYEEEIKALKENGDLKRNELKALKEAEKNMDLINKELVVVEKIERSWSEEINKGDQLIELLELKEGSECFEVETNEGLFFSDEIEIEIIIEEELEYFELIAMDYVPTSTEWVKKKANSNCLSLDPNDCLVWCLVEKVESYNFRDIEGFIQKFKTCPTDFEFDQGKQQCISRKVFKEEKDTLQLARLKRINDGKILELIKWNLIKC